MFNFLLSRAEQGFKVKPDGLEYDAGPVSQGSGLPPQPWALGPNPVGIQRILRTPVIGLRPRRPARRPWERNRRVNVPPKKRNARETWF